MNSKNNIKEQLNNPETARSKSKERANLNPLDIKIKRDRRSRTKPRNNLVKGAETEIKEVSGFAETTKIEEIHNEYEDNSPKKDLRSES